MDENRRNTKQKQIISSVFYSLYHPTANEVYEEVKKVCPQIGRATVYRFLNRLTLDGEISRIVLDENVVVYDKNVIGHAHFFCKKCGKIFDVPFTEEIKDFTDKIKITDEYCVENVGFFFTGLCSKCKNNIIKEI